MDKYPGYFISPLRLSGPAVEILFGHFKYSSGGKLDAANYSTARATDLTTLEENIERKMLLNNKTIIISFNNRNNNCYLICVCDCKFVLGQ